MVLAVAVCLFGFGAVLIVTGNAVRKTSVDQRRTLWVKYATYVAIVGFWIICASNRVALTAAILFVSVCCAKELMRFGLYAAIPWLGVSTLCLLGVERFVPMYLVVASADAFGQLGGRLLGGPKLWPRISPQKAISGVISGLAFALVTGHLVGLPPASSAALACAGVGGDLAASWMKRSAGIKDFGSALPGHGGFMDRFDSLWGAAPLGFILC